MKKMRPKIKDLVTLGREILQQEHKVQEESKRGILRGGNAGAIINDKAVGKCLRVALLRTLGIEAPITEDRLSMFAAGISSEDIVLKELDKSWSGPILAEEDIGIEWETATEPPIKVTGRPDIVLCDREQNGGITPVEGVELKLVSSIWTAISVGIKREPKSDHLIQAGHYSWKLGIPFTLYYASRVDWPVLDWIGSKLIGNINRDFIRYRNDKPFKLVPFDSVFQLDWTYKKTLYYKHEAEDEWISTFLTVDSIKEFYRVLAESVNNRVIPQRPSGLLVTGKTQTYNSCDAKYCPYSEICDKYEGASFDTWLDYCSTIINEETD